MYPEQGVNYHYFEGCKTSGSFRGTLLDYVDANEKKKILKNSAAVSLFLYSSLRWCRMGKSIGRTTVRAHVV